MKNHLHIYNTLTRKKEAFKPINPSFVGMYVCGPTVYGDAHLGHARCAINFDVVYRFFCNMGYKVRYVRNITDVGHLEGDTDEGEDKLAKKAKLEKLEPMEIAQYYTNSYHSDMQQLNVLSPNIEPRASGHIPEQIKMIEEIIEQNLAYVVNGSVYFDVEKYNKTNNYGKLSGRILEDLIAGTRILDSQTEKRNPFDFALWKKSSDEHIMQWESPWGKGFPGWHIECSVMGSKYLGTPFDIHGGGMDLLFPHHECEIAQTQAGKGIDPVNYWMHNNMITINGQKMGKSLNNFITLKQLFTGQHSLLEKAYSPMTIRFFILQAHYRSTLDFSNEALQAAEKGLLKLTNAISLLNTLVPGKTSTVKISSIKDKCDESICDDFNTAVLIAHLFDGVRIINSVKEGNEELSLEDIQLLKSTIKYYLIDILGIQPEQNLKNNFSLDGLMKIIIDIRNNARTKKDFATSDKIRDELLKINFYLKDESESTTWHYKS